MGNIDVDVTAVVLAGIFVVDVVTVDVDVFVGVVVVVLLLLLFLLMLLFFFIEKKNLLTLAICARTRPSG